MLPKEFCDDVHDKMGEEVLEIYVVEVGFGIWGHQSRSSRDDMGAHSSCIFIFCSQVGKVDAGIQGGEWTEE